MTRCARLLCALVVVLPLTAPLGATPAHADPRESVREALREGHYGFCSKPRKPLTGRQAALCPLADEIDACEGLVRACAAEPPPERHGFFARLLELLAPVAKALVYLLVALILVAVAVPVVLAILRAKRDRKATDAVEVPPNAAEALAKPAPEPSELTDAESALRAADDHARRGEHDRALALYLAASLAALGRRGAIRLARHRTNGEYVRACAEEAARQPLREIVREVDRVQFGHLPATPEAVARVASRASSLVRIALVSVIALVLSGCGALARGGPDDPAGDELPMDVLRRNAFVVKRLESSLATLPMPDKMPDGATPSPALVVDASTVPLEEETQAHLVRWVEHGGHLILLGDVASWPEALRAKPARGSTRALEVGGHGEAQGPDAVTGARTAGFEALEWPDAEPVATVGDRMYAAIIVRGEGMILGVANDDLFTNVGVARPDNAAALVSLVSLVSPRTGPREIRVARAEDGIPPPSNPFAALLRAGLGKGALHALAASIVLFLAYGIRQARAREVPPPTRRTFAEHVEATGALWGRAKAHSLALAAYGRFAEVRLRDRLPRGADPATFLAARAGIDPARAAEIWTRATTAKRNDVPRGDEIAIIKELRAVLAKVL